MAKAKKKERAKWGSKTRHGETVKYDRIPAVHTKPQPEPKAQVIEYTPVSAEPPITVQVEELQKRVTDAKVILAALIVGDHDRTWSSVLRQAVVDFLRM